VPTVAAPTALTARLQDDGQVLLQWTASADARSYKVYSHFNSAPDYRLVSAEVKALSAKVAAPELQTARHGLFRVTAVDARGRESAGARVVVEMPEAGRVD
jgi:hypothetical protein